MRTTYTSLARRVITGASVIALGATGLLGVAAQANPGPDFGNIDPDATGSITLHKRESGSRGSNGTIHEAAQGGTPVGDVTFTYFPITGLDLKTTDAWHKLSELQVPTGVCDGMSAGKSGTIGGYAFGPGVDMPATDANSGDTTINNLAIGAYLICETAAPSTVKKKSLPFVATLPSPRPDNKGWTYDVHAYPKNTVIQPATKTVQTDVTKLGVENDDQVTFKIRAKVPQLSASANGQGAKDEFFKYFMLGDSLVEGYSNGKIASVQIADDADGTGASVIGTENYVATDSTTPNNQTPHWLSVSFNAAGLSYLKGNPNKYVIVTITVKVTGLGQANGNLGNTGYFIVDTETTDNPTPPTPTTPPITPPNTPGQPPTPHDPDDDPIIPTNKVVTTWGQAKLKKHAADQAKTPLKDAVFEIYEAKVQDATCSSTEIPEVNPVKVSIAGESTFTSDQNGIVLVKGLFVGEGTATAPNEPTAAPTYRCYVFKEITAPAGYVLPAGDQALKAVKVEPGTMADAVAPTFKNTQVSVPELPLTGANGQVLMIVGGAASVLLAGGIALVSRRRRAMED